jgi:hypothetical protein
MKYTNFRAIFTAGETFIKIFSKLIHKKMLMENFHIFSIDRKHDSIPSSRKVKIYIQEFL